MASPRGVSLTHDPGTVAATLASAVTTANKNPPEGYGPQWTAAQSQHVRSRKTNDPHLAS
jgi:hypothetical protein